MATAAEITVVSVTDAPWEDVSTVFGERGDPAGCWCQFFKVPNAGWDSRSHDRFKGMLHGQVRANDPAPGGIASASTSPNEYCVRPCRYEPSDVELVRDALDHRGEDVSACASRAPAC